MLNQSKLLKVIAKQQNQIKEQQNQIDKLLKDMRTFKRLVKSDKDLNHFKEYGERKDILIQQSENNILFRLMHHILGYYYQDDKFISYLDLQNLFAISIGILRKESNDKEFIKQLKVDYVNNPCWFERYGAYNKTLIRENYHLYSGSFIIPDKDDDLIRDEFKVINLYLDNFYDVYIKTHKSIEFCQIIQQKLFDNELLIGEKIPFRKLTLITQ